jgi:hypothetical protein
MSEQAKPIMLAQASTAAASGSIAGSSPGNDAGFRLPGNDAAASSAAAAGSANAGATTTAAPIGIEGARELDTSTRDLTLGGGIFLVLLLAFFFARGAYVNHLVARRVAPSSAGSAGWLLFIGLSFLSASLVLALINSAKYLNFWITAPLLLVGLGCLIGALLTGRR